VPRSLPTVSIIIPTLNEGEALPVCLAAVSSQSLEGVELIIVDSSSKDGTRETAVRAGATVVDYPGRPLGARRAGLQRSRGKFVLLLDADQVLYPDTLERAVAAMDRLDMLALEESSYEPKGFLQKSIARQKSALQGAVGTVALPPHVYPRLYRREVLEAAFQRLPQETLGKVFAFDDRVLFAKAKGISDKVGLLPRGVMHIEEASWRDMMRHAFRQGKSAKSLKALGLEEEASAPEPAMALMRRAARNHYLTYSVLKEASFRIGKALG